MQSVFPADICLEILSYLRRHALGRISLISKNARQQTWSLASRIDIKDHIDSPFDSIFQYTGEHLKTVRLSHLEQFPTTIRHLVDHCPRLEHLIIERGIIMTFTFYYDLIEQLIQRVDSLTVSALQPHPGDYLNEPFGQPDLWMSFQQILSVSTGPLKITYFSVEDEGRSRSGRVGSLYPDTFFKRFTSLETIKLPAYDGSFIDVLKGIRTLKRIHVRTASRIPYLRDILSWIQGLLETQVGWNIYFEDSETGYKDSTPLFAHVMKASDFHSADLTYFGSTAGVKKVDPAHVALALDVMMEEVWFHRERWIWFLNAVGVLSTILPPMDQIRSRVNAQTWMRLIAKYDAQVIRRTFAIFGVPVECIDPAAALELIIQLPLPQLQAKLEVLEQCGLLDTTQLDAYFSSNMDDRNLFSLTDDLDVLRYLLTQTSRECALSELRRNAVVRGKRLHSPLTSLLSGGLTEQLSLVLQNFKDDNRLLSFPDAKDFDEATSDPDIIADTDMLRRIVEATGLQNINADSRGTLFWRLLRQRHNLYDGSPSWRYWIALIESDPSIEPFLVSDAVSPLMNDWSPNHTGVLNALLRYRDLILKQAPTGKHSITMVRAIGRAILRFYDPKNLGPEASVNVLLEQIFLPLVRVLAASGRCPCSALPTLHRYLKDDTEAYMALRNLCVAVEFSEENSRFHSAGSKALASALLETCWYIQETFPNENEKKRFVLDLIECWWDLIQAEDWNLERPVPEFRTTLFKKIINRNLMEVVLRTPPPHPRLQQIIGELVRRGARIRNNSRSGYFAQSIETYFAAVREAK